MSIPNPERSAYLGDSVYITNGFGTSGFLEIFTCNGGDRENVIYLDVSVARSLMEYISAAINPPEPQSDVDI